MQCDVCLASFDGSDFDKGAGFLKISLWYFVNALDSTCLMESLYGNQGGIAVSI